MAGTWGTEVPPFLIRLIFAKQFAFESRVQIRAQVPMFTTSKYIKIELPFNVV